MPHYAEDELRDYTGYFHCDDDWLRFGMGGHNVEANSILYYTINRGIQLGQVVGEDSFVLESWSQTAEAVKASANNLLWDDEAGMYRDNETTTLQPQDGNCWAVLSNITNSTSQQTQISAVISSRWNAYGAPVFEAANAISPFISGFELQAHLLAGNTSATLELIRLE